MKGTKTPRIQDLVGLLHRAYPPGLAESWDNVGLQVGDPVAEVTNVLVSLDPSLEALEAARKTGAQAILSHHPLIFRPLKSLTPTDETGRIIFQAIQNGIALLAAHTNLDRARNGLNDWLAQELELESPVPLNSGEAGDLFKIVVFVPVGHEGQVAEAMFEAGAGHIGGYDRCSFRCTGTGTFRGGEGTQPFLGKKGVVEQAPEIRLETVVPRERLGKVLEKMQKAHPYEEVAFDLIPLANRRPGIGLGRIGRLVKPVRLDSFARRVKKRLGTGSVRLVGNPATMVSKVAVCGGSGAGMIGEAVRQGADVLVTGDLKYHEARQAEESRLGIIDAGHFATERLMAGRLADTLNRAAKEASLEISFTVLEQETDPFRTL